MHDPAGELGRGVFPVAGERQVEAGPVDPLEEPLPGRVAGADERHVAGAGGRAGAVDGRPVAVRAVDDRGLGAFTVDLGVDRVVEDDGVPAPLGLGGGALGLVGLLGGDQDDLVAPVPHHLHQHRVHEEAGDDHDDVGPPGVALGTDVAGGELGDLGLLVGLHPGARGVLLVRRRVPLQELVELEQAGLHAHGGEPFGPAPVDVGDRVVRPRCDDERPHRLNARSSERWCDDLNTRMAPGVRLASDRDQVFLALEPGLRAYMA